MCLIGSYGNLYAAHFPKTGDLSLATFPLALSAFPQFPPETKENQPKAFGYLFVQRWGDVHTIWIWPSLLDHEDICENDTLADWFEEQGGDRQASWCPGQGFQPCTRLPCTSLPLPSFLNTRVSVRLHQNLSEEQDKNHSLT